MLAFLSTILYVYLYPKTRINLYDTDYAPIRSFEVKRYSTLESLPDVEKTGYTFKYWTYDDFELNGGTRLDKNAELTEEVRKLKVEKFLNEKLSATTLRPRSIRMIKESLEDKEPEEVKAQIDDAIIEAEKEEEKQKAQGRKALQQRCNRVLDQSLSDEDPAKEKKQEPQKLTEGNTVSRAFGRIIKNGRF